MDQLLQVPQDQEIAFFYSLIRQDPGFLQGFDQKQFADTPLHFAAAEGRTQLALEIQRLMPSFGSKLNPDGFSPVDLALQRGQNKTVSAMIRRDPELVGVQGREGMTPLHYAAETDDVEMLAEFLLSCPDSIKKLTVREETAAHVAVKNGKLAAFRVLLGWLKRTDRTDVLRWRDWEGNTVLHLAAYTNQPKVMSPLVYHVPVNDKNSKGLTALDIVMKLPTKVNRRARAILCWKRAKRGSAIGQLKIAPLADYLSSRMSFMEGLLKAGVQLRLGMPDRLREAVLVVAVLVVTATFQAVLSPPGDFGDQTPFISNTTTSIPHSSSATNITSNIGVDVLKTQKVDIGNGKVSTQKEDDFLTFVTLNSIALAASLGIIYLHLQSQPYSLLHLSLLFLLLSYIVALKITSPFDVIGHRSTWMPACILFLLIVSGKIMVSHWPKHNPWNPKRLIGSNNFFNIHEVRTLVYHSKYSHKRSNI